MWALEIPVDLTGRVRSRLEAEVKSVLAGLAERRGTGLMILASVLERALARGKSIFDEPGGGYCDGVNGLTPGGKGLRAILNGFKGEPGGV